MQKYKFILFGKKYLQKSGFSLLDKTIMKNLYKIYTVK